MTIIEWFVVLVTTGIMLTVIAISLYKTKKDNKVMMQEQTKMSGHVSSTRLMRIRHETPVQNSAH